MPKIVPSPTIPSVLNPCITGDIDDTRSEWMAPSVQHDESKLKPPTGSSTHQAVTQQQQLVDANLDDPAVMTDLRRRGVVPEGFRKVTVVTISVDEKSLPSHLIPIEPVLPRPWLLYKVIKKHAGMARVLSATLSIMEPIIYITDCASYGWGFPVMALGNLMILLITAQAVNRHVVGPVLRNFYSMYIIFLLTLAWTISGAKYVQFSNPYDVAAYIVFTVTMSLVFVQCIATADTCQSISRCAKLIGNGSVCFLVVFLRYKASALYGSSDHVDRTAAPFYPNNATEVFEVCTGYYACADTKSIEGSLWGSVLVLIVRNIIFTLLYPSSFVLVTGGLKIVTHKTLVRTTWQGENAEMLTPYSKISKLALVAQVPSKETALQLARDVLAESARLKTTGARGTIIGGVRNMCTIPIFEEISYEPKPIIVLSHVWIFLGITSDRIKLVAGVNVLIGGTLLMAPLFYKSSYIYILSVLYGIFGVSFTLSSQDRRIVSLLMQHFETWYLLVHIAGIWILFTLYERGDDDSDVSYIIIRMLYRLVYFSFAISIILSDAVLSMKGSGKFVYYFVCLISWTVFRVLLEYNPTILSSDPICIYYYSCMLPIDVLKNLTSPLLLFSFKFVVLSFIYPDNPVILHTRIEWRHA